MTPRAPRGSAPALILSLLLPACAPSGAATPSTAVVNLAASPAPDAREELVYCARLAERRGITTCAAPIDAETQRHREESWILHMRGGRPVRLEHVNGSGRQTVTSADVGAIDILYDGPRVKEETGYAPTGRLVERRLFSEDATRVDYRDHLGRPRTRAGGKYTTELRAFDERGFITSERFFDAQGAPSVHKLGVHEIRYRRDAHGLRTEIRYFDAERRPTLSNEHFHHMTYVLNALGDPVKERTFDVTDAPAITSYGAHSYTAAYDRWGNVLDVRFFAIDGSPAVDRRTSARWTATYDARGNRLTTAFIGVDGWPAEGPDGWAQARRRFDERGLAVEWAYFGTDGLPTRKVPVLRARYDQRGRVVEWLYFDASGQPRTAGYASVRIRHDDRDNEIEIKYFDASGKPVDGGEGAFGYATAYDDRDRALEKSYFGADGRPVMIRGGYALVRYRYGESGELLHEDRFDLDGKPASLLGAKHLLVMYQGSRRAPATITRTRDEAKARAEEARQKILAGLSFNDAVRIYSDEPNADSRHGDLGRFPRGAMVPEFEREVERLKVDEMGGVVETLFGFHVVVRTY